MADVPKGNDKRELEEEVWVAISAFEQILEAMPNDRASLEALSHAYGQIGDHAREKEYVIRLGNLIVDEGDRESAAVVLDKLEPHLKEDSRVPALVDRLRGLLQSEPSLIGGAAEASEVSGLPDAKHTRGGFNMSDELSCAWTLFQANQLNQEEYASVVHDLAEMSSQVAAMTVSVLHVLEFRTSKNMERVMAFIARECETPIINLASFGIPVDAMTMLPLEFMVRRGVLVFEFIGQDVLAVLMNPYNRQLRADVEIATNRKCHFFLCLPSDFDHSLARIRAFLDEKAGAEHAAENERK